MFTGLVRRIDDLGRIVIPREVRRSMGISDGDPLEIECKDDQIILTKYQPNEITASELVRTAGAKLVGIDDKMSNRLYKIAEELARDEF